MELKLFVLLRIRRFDGLWKMFFDNFENCIDLVFTEPFFAVFNEQLNVKRRLWWVVDHHEIFAAC